MANPKNTAAVKELTARFQNTSTAILTEYRGLSVTEMTELRKELGADVEYSVAKNTMIKLAAKLALKVWTKNFSTAPPPLHSFKAKLLMSPRR